jgi:hypothetical protein
MGGSNGILENLAQCELRDLCISPNAIKVMTPRRMRWVGHAARMGEKENAYREEKDKSEVLGVVGKILLKLILKEIERRGLGWIDLAHYRNK